MLDKWFRKEKPIQGMMGFGGGFASRVLGSAEQFQIRGGQFFNPGDGYFYHLFEGAGVHTLEAKGKGDIDIYIVGAGGGRSTPGTGPGSVPSQNRTAYGGGAGGSVQANGFSVSAGNYTIQLGGGGNGATSKSSPTPGGYNGGGVSGICIPSPPGYLPPDRGTGGGGGGFSRFYDPSTTYVAAGGGGAGARGSALGGDDPNNPGYIPNSTTGGTGYTSPSGPPGGSDGGGGSGGGFNGSGGGGGNPSTGGGYGGDSYVNPLAASSTFYKGNSSGTWPGSGGSYPQAGGFDYTYNSAPPSRVWIPQEPSIGGAGSNSIGFESGPNLSVTSKTAVGGYAILRYAAAPSVSDFTTSGVVSNLTPHIPGNGYEYFVMTSPGTVVVTKNATFDVLAVGGGGGTATYPFYNPGPGSFEIGWRSGGGGGAVVNSSVPVSAGNYPITVGSGGVATSSPGPASNATPGGDTTAFGLSAPGGSAGVAGNPVPGGSPGGGQGNNSGAGGSGVQVSGFHPFYVGLVSPQYSGVNGVPANIPGSAYYGGGGGGSGYPYPGSNGGGGNSSFNPQVPYRADGVDGFGGGGSQYAAPNPNSPGPRGSNGGSGIVIFRVQL